MLWLVSSHTYFPRGGQAARLREGWPLGEPFEEAVEVAPAEGPFERLGDLLVVTLEGTKAQAILAERGEHAKRRGNASKFLLSGLLRCGRCGKAYIGMSANGNGGRYHYCACTGRQKYGPKACTGERLPREKLEQAVLHQLASLYRNARLIGEALAKAQAEAERRRPEFEQRRASIAAEIARAEQALERYYEAFEQGELSPERCEDRLTRLQARLDDLRAHPKPNSRSLRHTRPHRRPRPPTSPPSPNTSNASSPKPSRRRRKRFYGF